MSSMTDDAKQISNPIFWKNIVSETLMNFIECFKIVTFTELSMNSTKFSNLLCTKYNHYKQNTHHIQIGILVDRLSKETSETEI